MEAGSATHPTADTLRALGLGQLDDASAAALMNHLENCPECRKEAAALCGEGILERLPSAGRSGATAADAGDPAHTAGDPPKGQAAGHQPTIPYAPLGVPVELRDHPQYEVLRELGRGGMGVVYLARNKLMDRPEVLKVVHKQFLDHPGAAERFLREIRSAAKLNHPNIVTAHSALRIGDLLVFAMEYVEGETLAQFVHAYGRLPAANACYYGQQVALGLQHAFEKGMVHRDIKPQNLILAREGKKHVVKILDFGLAKATREGEEADSGLTGSGAMMGTPDYIAPEQTLDAARADIRADIYSLGCTLYFLLAGRPPFKGNSQFELLLAHRSASATPLGQVRPDVPASLEAVVAKMMAKEPAKRYQKPIEVAQALAPFVKGGIPTPPLGVRLSPVSPEDPTPKASPAAPPMHRTVIEAVPIDDKAITPPKPEIQKPKASVERQPQERGAFKARMGVALRVPETRTGAGKRGCAIVVGISVAALLLLAVPLGLWLGGVFPPKPPNDEQAPQVVEAGPDLTGGRRFVHFGPGGPRVVLWSNDDKQKRFYARVYNLSTGEAISPPLTFDDGVHAAFSPDGTRVLTASRGTARVWDAVTGQAISQPMPHEGGLMRARFSQDGQRVATASLDRTARVWDAVTGQPITPPLKHDGWVRIALFSPDSKRVVTASEDKTARLWNVQSDGGAFLPLTHGDVVWYASFSPDGQRVVTASRDKTARVWDAATGQPISPPLKHDHWVTRALFSPDGKRVATASIDKTARVWDAASGQAITPPLPHGDYVWDASFSPDGTRVVTASSDKTARVWDAATGEAISLPLQHDVGVWQATFSPDGKQVVTAGQVKGTYWCSETARLWDAATGQELKKVTISADAAAPVGAKDAKDRQKGS
jgi:serine/threonine protein kinase/WD40 repeat protein